MYERTGCLISVMTRYKQIKLQTGFRYCLLQFTWRLCWFVDILVRFVSTWFVQWYGKTGGHAVAFAPLIRMLWAYNGDILILTLVLNEGGTLRAMLTSHPSRTEANSCNYELVWFLFVTVHVTWVFTLNIIVKCDLYHLKYCDIKLLLLVLWIVCEQRNK